MTLTVFRWTLVKLSVSGGRLVGRLDVSRLRQPRVGVPLVRCSGPCAATTCRGR
jgi:hypothetical protein